MKITIDRIVNVLGLDDETVFFTTALRMVLITLLLFVVELPLNTTLVPLMILPGLLISKVLFNRFYWLFLALVFVYVYFICGLKMYLPNHKYMFAFTVIICTIAMFLRHYKVEWKPDFAKAARWVIGFCFFFATIGKFLAPEFLDGSFFEYTLLTDERFFGFTHLMGGEDFDKLTQNSQAVTDLLLTSDPSSKIILNTEGNLRAWTLVLSYWTIFIEGMIALTFLAPVNSWLHRKRELFLIAFIVTTYPIATVPGFATLLAALAFIQSYQERKGNIYNLLFIVVFLAIPFMKMPYYRVLNYLTGL